MAFNYFSQGGYVHDCENVNDTTIEDDDNDYQDIEPWCDRVIRTNYYPAIGKDLLYLHILANELGITDRVNWDYINQSVINQ